MATKAVETNKETNNPATTTVPDGPPEGMKKLSFDLIGFYQPTFEEAIYGKIVSFRKRKKEDKDDKDRYYYVIELIRPIHVVNFEKQKVLAPLGSYVWLDERAGYMSLRDYVQHEGICWIKPLKLVPLKGGKKTWRMDVRVTGKVGQPPTASMDAVSRPTMEEDKEVDDDSPPF